MDSEAYININVLANYFIPWVRNYPDSVFQQDRALDVIRNLDWAAQSPDLNPIVNLWDHLNRQVRKRKLLPQTKQELIAAI